MSEQMDNTPNEPAIPGGGRRTWRSLEEWAGAPEFEEARHREFPRNASEMNSAFSRRSFLGLMAASAALASSLAGCRRPEVEALPYTKAPERQLPGVPTHYATSLERAGGQPIGVIVTCHEGRPIKIEGNPDHPASLGAVDPITQSLVLELYDPERSKVILKDNNTASFEEFLTFAGPHFADLKALQGEGLAFLAGRTTSPSLRAQRKRLLTAFFPKASWHTWEPVNDDAELEGTQAVFGQRVRPLYDLSKADVVLSLDCDFLSYGPRHLAEARAFAARRAPAPGASMNRLYAIEAVLSTTGAAADHRLTLPSSRIRDFALAFYSVLLANSGTPLDLPVDRRWLDVIAEEVRSHKGRTVVLAGERQPAEVHELAAIMNAEMGRECVRWVPTAEEEGALASLKRLADAMNREQVKTLVMLGGNPVYDAPAGSMFREGLAKVGTTIQLSLYPNETTKLSQWHLPLAHALESWGDTQYLDGTISLTQPLIAPLFGGMTTPEFLALLAGETKPRGYDLLRAHYQASQPAEAFEAAWRKALHDGIFKKDEAIATVAIQPNHIPSHPSPLEAPPKPGEFELVFLPHPYLHDGRYANNGWLQETPEPITKLSWDNAALLSVRAAGHLKVKNEDVIRIETTDGNAAELPVWIVPGMDDGTVAVHLGYGRTTAGRVGTRHGVNVYPLRTAKSPYVARGVKLIPTGRRMALATMQNHGAMAGRDLVRETTPAEIQKPAHATHGSEGHGSGEEHAGQSQLWTPPLDPKADPQWAMAIDLSKCVGCHACVLACQAENNIPIVGKEQIAKGRIMQWLRVDRYFTGPAERPEGVAFQPVPCQQCETAPCEQVCPVAATTHSPDGLNEMTYNRCIGTRYCSNNCPYKVRRFNFFNYRKGMSATEKMAMNPDVTVRMRGVMEKCTYCVQRIARARVKAKAEGREVRDGEVLTACQQACPAQAIVFGNQADPNSQVAAAKRDPRNYVLLEEFNFRPRTSYLARLRNPNPKLERSEG